VAVMGHYFVAVFRLVLAQKRANAGDAGVATQVDQRGRQATHMATGRNATPGRNALADCLWARIYLEMDATALSVLARHAVTHPSHTGT